MNELDAFIDDNTKDDLRPSPLLFVGNGKIGAVVKDTSSLYVFYEVLVQHIDNKNNQKIMREEQRTLR